jgi:hypothetical protein
MSKPDAFVVLNDGVQVASYSTALPFGEFKAFQFAKQNMTTYGGVILARDINGDLSAVNYADYKSES